nr:hypothetical protein [Tanacetum cinerariifolium]
MMVSCGLVIGYVFPVIPLFERLCCQRLTDIATFVGKCLICQHDKIEHQRVTVAKEKLKEVRSRQKSYVDQHRRELAFNPEDRVFLKVSLCRVSYPLDQIREDLSLVEEPEKILGRQERFMRNKTISFVKILWKNHPEREATWATKESIRASYPRFFSSF